MLNTILTLTLHHWRLFWADRRAALFAFAVPIVLASTFGMVFDRPKSSDMKLPVLFVCDSDTAATRELARALSGSPRLESQQVTLADAERRVADRQPGVAIIVTDGPHFRILHHPNCGNERQWAEGVITETAMLHHAKSSVIGPMILNALPKVVIESTPLPAAANFNAYSHSFSGMTLQYLLFWGMESGLLFLRERQRGVWKRVRTTPATLLSLFLGKALATALIALLIVMVTFAFGRLVFGVTIAGSFAGFLLLAVTLSVLAAATGLVVAALGGTEARARSVCILAILGVSLLGGLWVPAFVLPGWVREMALALPTTWAMQGLEAVTWQGRGFLAVLPSAGAVLAFTILFLGVALWRLQAQESRRRLGGSA